VKCLSGKRPGDGAVRADEPKIEAELMRYGQGKGVAASGNKNHFNARGVSAPERVEIARRNLKLGVEQRAIDIRGDEADGGVEGLNHPLF